MRACEICGHSDAETMVVASSIGPVSFNTCGVCAGMHAELNGFSEEYGTNRYCPETDQYKTSLGIHIPILTRDGGIFNTRSEYITHAKEVS